MELCEEMKKLRRLLTEKGIEWHDESTIYSEELIEHLTKVSGLARQWHDSSIYRTYFDVNNTHYSVINGFGTYGGFVPYENKNYGLLECMTNDNAPVGWLTANDIIDMLGRNEDKQNDTNN
jgi:hypothetical protein